MYTYIPDAQINTPCVSVCLKIYKQTYSQKDQYTTEKKTYKTKKTSSHMQTDVYTHKRVKNAHSSARHFHKNTQTYIARITYLSGCVYLSIHVLVSIQIIICSVQICSGICQRL